MKRLRAKARPRRRYAAYRGRGRLESWGFLLSGSAGAHRPGDESGSELGDAFFRLPAAGGRRTFDGGSSIQPLGQALPVSAGAAALPFGRQLALVLVPLSILEICHHSRGARAARRSGTPACGGGAGGRRQRYGAVTVPANPPGRGPVRIWRAIRRSRRCSPAGQATARRSARPDACMTGSPPGVWTRID